jgi:cysteinyl-tRNA synthetase
MITVAYIYLYIYIYIYTHKGSYFLIKQKMNKSENNYIKIAMPVAKYTTEYAWKCCLEGILSVWVS